MSELIKLLSNLAAIVVIGAVVVFVFFMERVKIDNNQMAPTLVYGDEVLIWKNAHIGRTDIMVCEHPFRPGERVLARAVGFAGETVQTDRNGSLQIDQDRPVTQITRELQFYDITRRKQVKLLVGQIDYTARRDHLFSIEAGDRWKIPETKVQSGVYLLGDNRSENVYDSRSFGEVDSARCIGQVVMRWKPGPTTGDDLGHARFDFID